MDTQVRATIADRHLPMGFPSSDRSRVVVRSVFLLLSTFGIAFAFTALLSANSPQTSQRMYRQILAGESFSITLLTRASQRAVEFQQDLCDREARFSLALIELKLAEGSLAEGRSEEADAHLRSASAQTREQIGCSPTNGFAWFLAFWSEFLSGNLDEGKWRYIDASYRFAPHEAWVALIRLPLLAKIWSVVPVDRRGLVLDDFDMLMEDGYFPQCARLYALSSTDLRFDLEDRLRRKAESKKHQFNSALSVYDVDPIATEKGEYDAERLRKSMKGLSDALDGVTDR
jgi:hypothetical protein